MEFPNSLAEMPSEVVRIFNVSVTVVRDFVGSGNLLVVLPVVRKFEVRVVEFIPT